MRNTSLNELYKNLRNPASIMPAFMYMPILRHSKMSLKYANNEERFCHEAGFDAYMSGAIFVKIAHLHASIEYL